MADSAVNENERLMALARRNDLDLNGHVGPLISSLAAGNAGEAVPFDWTSLINTGNASSQIGHASLFGPSLTDRITGWRLQMRLISPTT